jgi:hypothetical protein
MLKKEKEEAKILSLSSLMTEEIGVVDDREQSDLDLKAAVTGEEEKDNFFGLDEAKANEKEAKLDLEADAKKLEETKETAEPKVEKKSESDVAIELEEPVAFEANEQSEFFKRSLKAMFGDTISHIIEEDSEGNEVEVLLENTVVTEEFFNQIIKSKLEEIKVEASKDKISTKGVSDFARDLVEIDRNNGDISELLKAKEAYSDPLDRLDLTNEKDQAQAIYLRMMAGGQDEDTTRRLINSYKSEGILEDKAIEAESELKEAIQLQVEKAKDASSVKAEQRRSLLKDYKKDIKGSLDKYELNDNVKNKVVSLATKEDETGRFELDKVYYKHRENPQDAADLALFLLDKEEYINQVTNKAVTATKLTTAKKLRVVTDGGGSPTLLDKKDRRGGGASLVSLDSLK